MATNCSSPNQSKKQIQLNKSYVKIYRDNDAIARLEDALNQAILLRDRLLDDFRTGRKRPKLLWEYY